LAYFGRPADVSGLSFYADKTEASVVAAFSASAESQAFFGSLNTLAQINTIYQNLFNRAAEPAGLTYWAGEINAGRLSLAQASMGILAGAQNADKLAVTNKLAAAVAFTAALDTSDEMIGYQGTSVITSARAYLASVDSTAASLTAATATTALNASVATVVAAGVSGASSAAVGSTFTLTTGVDTTTAKNITGLIDQNTAANTTWNLSDSVASSDGTFNLSVITAGAALAGFNTTGVTTLKVKPIDNVNTATSSSFDVGSMTGLKNVSVANASVIGSTADTFTINSAASGTTVSLDTNGSTQNVTVNYVSAATAGAADTANATITGRSGTFLLGTGFETLALTGGTAGRVAAANSETTASIKTVTVSGVDMRVDAALDSTVTSIDASNATGTVNLNAAPGTTFSAKGGKGTSDVLAVSVLSSTHTLTGFETVVATAAATYDLTGTDTNILGVGVQAGNVSFTNASATENNIVIGGLQQRTTAPAATGNLTTNGAVTWALKTATGTADTLNIAVNNGGTASTGTMTIGGAVTTSAVENIALAMTDWKAVIISGNVAITPTTTVNGKFTATGASNLSLTTNAIAFSGGLASGTDTVDLTGLTGTFTGALTMGSGNLTFTGGSGVTTLTTSAPVASKIQDITTGAGADVITITSMATTAGTTKVTAGAGDDRITLDATADQVTTNQVINIDGGAGTDMIATVGTGDTKTINATISNIETIQLESGTATTTLNFTVASGYADTVRIIDASGQTQTVGFNTSAGGTVNLSKFTTVGWTSGTDILRVISNTGAETFTFGATTSAAGAIAETYQALSAATNGSDTISGFTVGNGGDIINILRADTTGTATSAATANVWTKASTAVNAANEIIVLDAATYATAADAEAALTTYAGATIGGARTDDVIFVYSNGTNAFVYRDVNCGTTTAAGADLTLMVTLTGIASVGTMTVQNFGLPS